jgi:RNA polymerase sigma-70 factor (ECF subfamily)
LLNPRKHAAADCPAVQQLTLDTFCAGVPAVWSLNPDHAAEPVMGPAAREERLLERIATGDAAALDHYYRIFSDRVYSVACRLLFDQEEAREVLQDVFVKIWEKASSYDASRSSPLAWTVLITRGLCMDRIRHLSRRSARIEKYRTQTEVHEPWQDGSDTVLTRELTGRIRSAVGQLPEEERQCVALAVFNELTQQEVADELKLPLGTAKTRIRRGLIRLRNLIRRSHDGPGA